MKYQKYHEMEINIMEEEFSTTPDFEIRSGNSKIMLSAPHTVPQLRRGKIKQAETRTGIIVHELHEKLACPIIYKTQSLDDDANYDKICKYKTALVGYIREQRINLLLDFHISAPERPFAIDIGTGEEKNIMGRFDLRDTLYQSLSEQYKPTLIDGFFAASYPHTVSATIARQAKIPAFQLEINWQQISDFNRTERFIKSMCNAIERLEVLL